MAGYGVKEARINRERKPRVNVCGSCGDECTSLICDECRGEVLVTAAPSQWEPTDEQERRTR